MAILNIQIGEVGLTGIKPQVVYIDTNDTLSEVTTAGYLNKAVQNGASFSEYDMALVSTKTSPSAVSTQVAWLEVSKSGSDWSLVPTGSPGEIILPTIANYLVHATNVTGELSTGAANVTNAGSISAGLSGTSGSLISFPTTAANGMLIIAALNAGGAFNTTIRNSVMGQSSVISIPDPGVATAEFIISDFATTQHITSGALQVDAGAISSGLAAGGSAGSFIGYSPTASSGSLRLLAVNNAGDFAVTISNASHGQATVISIPDTGSATAEFMLSDSSGTQHITSGNFQVDAGFIASGLAAGGFVGLVEAFPTTAASGFVAIQAAVNATGDFGTTISNSTAQGQAQVVTVPDVGAATASFIMSASVAAAQSISSGLSITGNNNVQTSGGGQFIAGASGAKGFFQSNPTTAASGVLVFEAIDNATGDFDTTINNSAAVGQDQVLTIPDVGQATGSFLVNVLADSDPAADIVSFDVTVTAAALATGGTVTLQASSGAKQYKIRELFLNANGTNFSGGGGDRLATISDGTTSYSVIPAANLQALTNERWGTLAIPYPAGAAINTSTAAGAAITIAYSGGSADYGAGSMVISGLLERVA